MTKQIVSYPFVPKSTSPLLPGQFWAVPLRDRRFSAGRVMQITAHDGVPDRRFFLAGLLDWVGTHPPTVESIAGCGTLDQGMVHIKCVYETGGAILGYRPLSRDKLKPGNFLDVGIGPDAQRLRGTVPVRRATRRDLKTLPVLGWWGYRHICDLADQVFVDGVPLPAPCNETLEITKELLRDLKRSNRKNS